MMNPRNDLAIILTARTGSNRLPNKAIMDIEGRPLIWWIIKRLQLVGNVVLATTDLPDDDELAKVAHDIYVPVYRGNVDDVVTRVDNALREYAPDAKFVLRGLGDCPYISPGIVLRATQTLSKTNSEAFAWYLPSYAIQRLVYGSREFPYSRGGWERIVKNARCEEREHVDLYYHRNRGKFKIAYHDGPPAVYFRNYRLEVDWPEDLELVRTIAKEYDPMAELDHIIRFIDINDHIGKINRNRVEETGLLSSYSYTEMRKWFMLMENEPVMAWDDTIWQPFGDSKMPIFCDNGTCLIGYADQGRHLKDGVLHMRDGSKIVGRARLVCPCGAGKVWR